MKTKFLTLFLSAALLAACSEDDNPVAVSGITLDKPTLELTVGETGRLTVTVTPEDAADKNVVWKSGNTAAATVDDSGLVTAVAAGNATITATAGGKQATCEVTVTDAVPEGITVITYEALHEALQTGGTSADAPTLITLGGDITVPAGGDSSSGTFINGSGYFKIDGGGHTLAWENGSYYLLGNNNADADAVYIEFTNIKLVQDPNSYSAMVGVFNGRITLGGNVTLDGVQSMILAFGEKAALELGDGCELSYAAGSSSCARVGEGSTLVLNGGKTADGAYIELQRTTLVSSPLISVPKALTGDVHLKLQLIGIATIAQGTDGNQLTQADCDHLKVNPESIVSLYGEQMKKYDGNFELYLDPADHQIKLRPKNFTPPTGDIDMTSMTADEAQLNILAAIDAGYTEIKLTGELSKIGMGGNRGTFAGNTKIMKCDLSGVTGWGTEATLPGNAFMDCTALQEVTLPDGVQVIGEYAFIRCAALTTVNLPQVTRIDEYAFRECTSLAALTLDNVTAIDHDAFFGCTSLGMLEIPMCTRFSSYIVTGCNSLTRIEATAAGDFVDIDSGSSIERNAVFQNRTTAGHTGDNAFNPVKCDLVLNADKKQDGTAVPKVSNGNEWTVLDSYNMKWKSITFP